MTNLTINNKARTIEMTKKFEKAASRFGSDEYKALQEARRDNPTYKVIVKTSTAKSKENFKGLTYDYMKKYIAAHDDKDKTIMAEFEMLRGTSAEAKEMNAAARPYSASFLQLIPSPVVFSVIYQRSGKHPRKAAARNYNCIFPEPSPAAERCFHVPFHRGYSRPTL
ncbi:hypothetical protein B5G34_04260 [Flavonifractor sp. An82]|uniref:hypothetical protein n=1 Tax=Flavonifractor sp. An82 TaxID=1965660 RepID=UPI000B370A59|nr:hypothetical protein [Flavonifractor sp. An82]OUN23212.1 hypothetical protein B5G34_04260 [Flavonifractor sp. An82]